jgi:hypothetical protein
MAIWLPLWLLDDLGSDHAIFCQSGTVQMRLFFCPTDITRRKPMGRLRASALEEGFFMRGRMARNPLSKHRGRRGELSSLPNVKLRSRRSRGREPSRRPPALIASRRKNKPRQIATKLPYRGLLVTRCRGSLPRSCHKYVFNCRRSRAGDFRSAVRSARHTRS